MRQVKLYPENARELLEFQKVTEATAELAAGEMACRRILRMRIMNRAQDLLPVLCMQEELLREGRRHGLPVLDAYESMQSIIRRLAIENYSLPASQFDQLAVVLSNAAVLGKFADKALQLEVEEGLRWHEIFAYDERPLSFIRQIFDEKGNIRKGVSTELDRIYREKESLEKAIRTDFTARVKQYAGSGLLADNQETIINGRLALSLPAENKRKIKGSIVGESATGKTVFMEPESLTLYYERLTLLQNDEHLEKFRILQRLTTAIAPFRLDIQRWSRMLEDMDVELAKAKYALSVDANVAGIAQMNEAWQLKRFRHPLLQRKLESEGRQIVANDLIMDADKRILVISGPNAGGKSLVLKSVGLLQLMHQAGYAIPASEESRLPVYESLFVEIGDRQSIENDLSTYSSHLSFMKQVIGLAKKHSLVLIDELGNGTDPKMGGAIGEALLEEMLKSHAKSVITTHFNNIKTFATSQLNIENGSMSFDTRKMEPGYQLRLGRPGSSFAFDIAARVGLKPTFIKRAKARMDAAEVDVDMMLAGLETEKDVLTRRNSELLKEKSEMEKVKASYLRLKESLEKEQKRLLIQMKQKEEDQLREMNRKIENELKDLTLAKRKSLEVKEIQKELQLKRAESAGRVSRLKDSLIPQEQKTQTLQLNDWVRHMDSDAKGQIDEIRKDKALVNFGAVRSLLPIKELVKLELVDKDLARKYSSVDYTGMAGRMKTTLDLRGMRGEEALSEMESMLDRAVALNIRSLKIIHGKGNGILRRLIAQQLKKYDFVESTQSDHPDAGGEGVTIVTLKE